MASLHPSNLEALPSLNLPSGVVQCLECGARNVVLVRLESGQDTNGEPHTTLIFLCLSQDREFGVKFTRYVRHTQMEVV